MLKTGGEKLDARLLRFRADPALEDPLALVDALLEAGRLPEALEVLGERADSPDGASILVAAGRAALKTGDLLVAQRVLMEAAERAPEDKEPLLALGEVLLKRGDPSRATTVLERAKALDADDPVIVRTLGRAQRLTRLLEDELSSTELPAAPPAPSEPPPVAAPPPPESPTASTAAGLAEPAMRPRRAMATQVGIGQLSPAAPEAPAPAPMPSEERTLVAPDLRAHFESELARLDSQDETRPVLLERRSATTPVAPPALDDAYFGGPESEAIDLDEVSVAVAMPSDDAPQPPAVEPPVAAEAIAPQPPRRRGRVLIALVCVLAIGAAAGYFGYQRHRSGQRTEAATLLEEARTLGLRGDTASVEQALARVASAVALSPSTEAAELGLALSIEEHLDRGVEGPGELPSRLEAASRAGAGEPLIALGRATAAEAQGDVEGARAALDDAPLPPIAQTARGLLRARLGEDPRPDLEAAIETAPELADANLALAILDAGAGRDDEARQRLALLADASAEDTRAQLLSLYLTPPADAAAQLEAIEAAAGAETKAEAALRALVEARVARLADDPTTAASSIDRALEATPLALGVQALALRELVALAEGSSDGAAARRYLERVLALSPTDVGAQRALATSLAAEGEYERAAALYDALLGDASVAAGADSAELRLEQVRSLLALGRVADARAALDGLAEADRAVPEAQIAIARVMLAEGDAAAAAALVRPLAAAEDADAAVLALHADALFASGQTGPAAAEYERALRRDGTNVEALMGYGTVLLRGDKHREAFAMVTRAERAIEEEKRGPLERGRALVLRGRLALATDDRRAATAALKEATELPVVLPEAYFHLGEALAGRRPPEARAAYRRYLEVAPEGPFAGRATRGLK